MEELSEESNPENLSADKKQRAAYIEGRPDLFKTKILRIKKERSGQGDEDTEGKNILVATRDPGSANALLPVLKELDTDPGIRITAITDGRAEEIIEREFHVEDLTPEDNILTAEKIIGSPNVILIDNSEEKGIDTYVSATFPDTPKILVEDYYANTISFLHILTERNIPLPDKICVMDEGAKELIIKEFPDLEKRIEVTGQPAFDRFATEDTERIARETREKLGLKPGDKLVSFMSTIDGTEKVAHLAEALKRISADFYFIFRRHPRDNTSYEAYRKILADAGIKVIDANDFSTNDIGAASDVVLTTWSTEGLHSIYRRKPTINIVDKNFPVPEGIVLPLVPVKLGASVGLDSMEGLPEILPQLLDTKSALNRKLNKKMNKYYQADGKNASRIAKIVKQYIK